MNLFAPLMKDKLHATGLAFLVLSLLIFCVPWIPSISYDATGLFIVNYVLAATYFFMILFSGRLKKGREGLHLFILFLILFLISAYSLNREMNVFEDSTTWFSCLLVILCISYLAFAWENQYPAWFLHILYGLLGVGFLAFFYLSCYLFPLYVLSCMAAPALGISLHTYVPVLFCIYTVVLLKKTTAHRKLYRLSFLTGMVAVILFVTSFTIRWGLVVNRINTAYNHTIAEDSEGLPGFVGVATAVPQGWIAEKALQSELVYNIPSLSQLDNFFWRMPTRNFGEEKKHDPLVMMAALFAGTPKLSADERIKILESVFDSRHKAQQRFWTGKHLVTDHIHTGVRIWPAFRMAYTEKLITVTNTAPRTTWGGEEEAIYTFHLPEGSVVSALSLWIKGLEAKGIVTTKEKADSAYSNIVGYQQRDPSVVHWQEGNTVSVRVFPVVAGESRLFKIGITSPLAKQADSLTYENIYFDGPDSGSADEEIKMDFATRPTNLVSEASFESGSDLSFKHSGSYDPAWKIRFKDEILSDRAFSFDGVSYTMAPYSPARMSADIHTVYLDINRSWTKAEFDQVWEAVKSKTVYVYDHDLVRLTASVKDDLFGSLSQLQFSLFPLQAVSQAADALLVTKSSAVSPNVHDLEGSRFMNEVKEQLKKNRRIKLFNIGQELSPYLKSLKEFRAFDYEQGSVSTLRELLARNQFAASREDDSTIVIDHAGMMITAKPQTLPSAAPDHLMRLFTYNHLMQRTGARLFTDSTFNTGLADEAAKAGIVTPVSSLVVLETQQDYDRFDIKESVNSLKNASLKSKGAVPEPHEWLLLLVAVSAILYLKKASKANKFRWS